MECPKGNLFDKLYSKLDEIAGLEAPLRSNNIYVKMAARKKLREDVREAAKLCKCLLEAIEKQDVCGHSFEDYKSLIEDKARGLVRVAEAAGVDLGKGALIRSREVILTLGEMIFGYVACSKVAPLVRDLCNLLEIFSMALGG